MIRGQASDYSLLPKDRSFWDLLYAFGLPYFAYVGLGGLLPSLIGPDLAQAARFLVVGGLLIGFRRAYAFGPRLTARQVVVALAGAGTATLLWIALLRWGLAWPLFQDRLAKAGAAEFSLLYAVLRTLNSVLLVPIFEELFIRAYIQEAAHAFPRGRFPSAKSLDEKPRALARPPLSPVAIGVACLAFAVGHDFASLLPASAYFLLTTGVYAWTRSFRTCVLIHALTNLAIAALVWIRPDMRFLWF